MRRLKKHLPDAVWLAYLLVMLWLLFLQRQPRFLDMPYAECLRTGLELMPFRATRRYLYIARHHSLWTAVVYLGGNLLCFVPLGFLLPCRHARLRRFGPLLLCTAAVIVLVELTQLFTTLGFCDVDDLIFNLTGAALGYALWSRPWMRRRLERHGWLT